MTFFQSSKLLAPFTSIPGKHLCLLFLYYSSFKSSMVLVSPAASLFLKPQTRSFKDIISVLHAGHKYRLLVFEEVNFRYYTRGNFLHLSGLYTYQKCSCLLRTCIQRTRGIPVYVSLVGVPGMARFLRVKVPPRVVTAKCSELQAVYGNVEGGRNCQAVGYTTSLYCD